MVLSVARSLKVMLFECRILAALNVPNNRLFQQMLSRCGDMARTKRTEVDCTLPFMELIGQALINVGVAER